MVYFSCVGMVNALGLNNREIAQKLATGTTGLFSDLGWFYDNKPATIGAVRGNLPEIPSGFAEHRSKNNQLILAALSQIEKEVEKTIKRYGKSRIAVILGSSTSGIAEGEAAIQHYVHYQSLPEEYDYQQQSPADPALFLSDFLSLEGPAYTISTACTSSARAIISGQRMIKAGIVDAALVGGADSLCRMTLHGFNSLESLSSKQCIPFAQDRCGINIGEGAALILLTKEMAPVALLGSGESSDAWHMTAPHPEGLGAEMAIQKALQSAGLQVDQIGYINLHGTATRLNDQMEAKAVYKIFGSSTKCSSTKHLTGHTLGAAGATEAALSWLILTEKLNLPCQDFSCSPKDDCLENINLLTSPETLDAKIIMSNSFAFGGSNASLIIGEPV